MGIPRQYQRGGRQWYVSDGYVWDDAPASFRGEGGRPWECSSQLLVFNPQVVEARVVVRFYHVDREPTELRREILPGRVMVLELGALAEVPHKQSFWVELLSDVPVLPQAMHADFDGWHPVPDGLCAVAPYPGPLEDELRWIFADGYQGSAGSWYEEEVLTILNPGDLPARVRVEFRLRWKNGGGEEWLEIPGKRAVALELKDRRPGLLGSKDGPGIHLHGDYATVVESDRPVVAQLTRRARWSGRPAIVGSRSYMGHVLREGEGKLWYYPGGDIRDFGALPRGLEYDMSWNLLFTFNPGKAAANFRVGFHDETGATSELGPIEVAAGRADLQWLHARELGKHVYIDRPYGMTLRSDVAVVPEVCGAEYEMWSQNCPGAMSAVNFYPGPLAGERCWWLGIGRAGGRDDLSVEWRQSWHVMNPGQQEVRVEMTFLGGEGAVLARRELTVLAGAVKVVSSQGVPELPLHEPFAVCVKGDGDFCAQTIGRSFTRGVRQPRAMYSFLGTPMSLA